MSKFIQASLIMMLFSTSSVAFGKTCTGKIFTEGQLEKPPVFFFHRTDKTANGGGVHSESAYKNSDGEVVFSEVIDTGPDGKILFFSQDCRNIGESGALKTGNGVVEFLYTREGKSETSSEKLPEHLLVGPWIVNYLHSQWEKLLKGDSLEVRFAVLDRKDTVGFSLFKHGEEVVHGRAAVVVKMKPTSFFISSVVKPMYFYFDKVTREMFYMKGRAAPKAKIDGKWQDIESESFYECRD
ncbi:MAG TPA: hypothetical protein DCS07_15425 [Bdellovibrionales bacterium]|nr:MAG: hypothetical protein A2Z97_15675 [Bdellovibrionales bacterium GWB1_52_6]OFZ02929.1 MAG: hypothetical protein A2X97_04980 [Bdellovibrionales bacterium GWA1_52_35]HAR44000.1 hypothetical protein [Bdellovibrionales bacterium]HCM38513.1 hypothetical protein [Bdellovibrionales bacterium]